MVVVPSINDYRFEIVVKAFIKIVLCIESSCRTYATQICQVIIVFPYQELDNTPRKEQDALLRTHKERLQTQQEQEEQDLLKKQKEELEKRLRKLKGRLLLSRHTQNQDQLREVSVCIEGNAIL